MYLCIFHGGDRDEHLNCTSIIVVHMEGVVFKNQEKYLLNIYFYFQSLI